MTILEILKNISVIGTIVTGLVSLIWPRKVQGFTGLAAPSGRGITEIRSILGGVFIGLGIAVLVLNTPEAYMILGMTYAVIAAIRSLSTFVDSSFVTSNIVSLMAEIILAIILVL